MLSYFVGLIGCIVGLVGWFGFKSLILLIIGTALYVLESIMESGALSGGGMWLDIVIFVIGCFVGYILHEPFYIMGMIFINIYSAILSIISIRMIINFFR